MLILIPILIYVVSFAITLLCLRQFAVWLGAGQTSYTRCFVALLLGYGVSFGIMTGVEATQAHPALTLIGLPIAVMIYAAVLDAGFFKALAIGILSGVVSGVLLVVLIMAVGFMGLGVAGAMMGTGMMAMDSDWNDGMPTAEAMDLDDMVVTKRTTTRAEGSTRVTITAHSKGMAPSVSAPEPEPARQTSTPVRPRKPDPTFAFQPVALESIASHRNAPVKLWAQDGREHAGTLIAVDDGSVVLRKRLSGGAFDFEVRLNRIQRAEVWVEVSS